MAYVDKRLFKASKESKDKIVLEVDESIKAKYIKWDTVQDEKYNKERYRFHFKLTDGKVKFISTAAKKVLGKMSEIAPGSVVMITKTGEQLNTDYDFEVLKKPSSAAQVEETVQLEDEDMEADEEDEEDEESDDLDPEDAPF